MQEIMRPSMFGDPGTGVVPGRRGGQAEFANQRVLDMSNGLLPGEKLREASVELCGGSKEFASECVGIGFDGFEFR